MCDFCDKIWDSLETYKNSQNSHWDESDIIYRNGNSTYLYLPCDDYYYNRSMSINYCPMCGRKLEKYK